MIVRSRSVSQKEKEKIGETWTEEIKETGRTRNAYQSPIFELRLDRPLDFIIRLQIDRRPVVLQLFH
jgi:hypothetical protein